MLEKILALPLKQKIGQLFFIGISGVEADKNLREFLNEITPGGVCLFARNIRAAEQVHRLLATIRELSAIDPILSLDEEGGVVDRLRRINTPLPAASAIKTIEQAENLAKITAEILKILGFNMNFAPVVDVIDEKREQLSNGLYSRAFGTSKEDVVKLAGAYLRTLQSNGCLGCLKHFPGLGASEVDSHEELPLVNTSRIELFENDLLPYRELIKTGQVHAVMVAHAGFPQFDLQDVDSNGKLLPSSLSFGIVTKLLREELGFDGLTISDDLEMGAILKNYGIGEACKLAINAGVDMLAICANAAAIRSGFYAVLEAVKNKKISEERIDQSLLRIAKLKNLMQPASAFNNENLNILSEKIAELSSELNYSYGG